MDIHEYTLWEVGYCGSLQDIANILEYPQEQVLFSGSLRYTIAQLPTLHTITNACGYKHVPCYTQAHSEFSDTEHVLTYMC